MARGSHCYTETVNLMLEKEEIVESSSSLKRRTQAIRDNGNTARNCQIRE